MKPYDDDEYLEQINKLRSAIHDFLNTEGNSEASLRDEIDNIIADTEVE